MIRAMDHRTQILDLKNQYCEATGLAAATVATKVANDGKFFDRIEAGGSFTVETFEKVMRWFQDNMPKPLSKPNGHRKRQ